MSQDILTELWRAGGASVRGASHARAALPNQDALRWLPAPGVLICALSDGHGSDKSFRSDLGALFAVQTALAVVPAALVESLAGGPALLVERLPRAIVQTWRQTVEHHLAAAPFTDAEWARLSRRDGDGARAEVEANCWLAYGATFLLCVVTPDFIVYAQLGDGDILLVSPGGAVARPRWPSDPRLFANETTSLCLPDAWAEMRIDVQPLTLSAGEPHPGSESHSTGEPHPVGESRPASESHPSGGPNPAREPDTAPALILLATDGYSNSFVDERAFARVGSDLLAMVRSDGFDAVCAGLPGWLEETSRLGSGDDITVGLVYRVPVGDTTPAPAELPAVASGVASTQPAPIASDQPRSPEPQAATIEHPGSNEMSSVASEQPGPTTPHAIAFDQPVPAATPDLASGHPQYARSPIVTPDQPRPTPSS